MAPTLQKRVELLESQFAELRDQLLRSGRRRKKTGDARSKSTPVMKTCRACLPSR
jgi:hypothetical protein